mgnify:CR=1 FL=1
MAAKKSGIHIKPENEGKLRRKMGAKKGEKLSLAEMKAKLAAAKKAGNTELVKQLTFAINARKWKH